MKGLEEDDSYKYLGIIQAYGMKKGQNSILLTSEKNTRNKTEWWKYNNRNKYMGIFITNILCCLSRFNRDRIRANG